jgi:D-psicose/D-tagatose/L-ribulose 3-epimerase
MPRFAVMTFMFSPWWRDRRVTHEAMLDGFADAGVEGIEPFHRDFVADPGLLERYRKCLAGNGIKVAAVDVMCNLVYGDEQQKRQDRDELRRGLDICRELGAEIAHVAGHKLRDGVSPADGRRMIAEGMAEVADIARDYGLVLAIEDFNPSPDLVCSAEDCLEIMRLSGGVVKFVFDTGNFSAAGERAEENFDLLADHIVHCHFKDFAEDPTKDCGYGPCDLGKGMIANAEVARRLTARGYDGWVALETRGRNDVDPVTAVRTEWPLLRSWFGEANHENAH